jgi:hypothetical protein
VTLLELTVALVVGGAALAAGGATFTTLADRRAALLADAQVEERALTAGRTLTGWIAAARVDADGSLRLNTASQRTAAGTVDDDTLSVVTLADGDLQRVRIFVARDDAGAALVADVVTPQPHRVVLAAHVQGFTVMVLSSTFDRREWRRRWAGGVLRPEALRLRLAAAEGTTLPGALRGDITVPLGGTP